MDRPKLLSFAVIVVAVALYCFFKCDNFDPKSVKNKRVLVTGASAGIGEQLAYEYAKLGAQIVITARRANVLEEVAEKCRQLGAAKVEAVAADMAVPADRRKVIEETAERLSGLDVLILNHAIYEMHWWTGSPENLTTLQKYLDVNLLSFVDLASRALPMLVASKGNIGVVSSVLGKIGSVEFVPYATTKFALQGFFSSFRQEMLFKGTGVSVTLCVLGLIDTDTAMKMHKEVHSEKDMASMAGSSKEAAVAILKGVAKEAYEIYYPWMAVIVTWIHKFIPGYLEDFATKHG